MALLGGTALTLADHAARMDNNFGIAAIIELLSQTNEILDDMLFLEGNLPTGHKSTVRTGIPQATWRLLNYGVPQGKSTTAQIIDTVGNLETWGVVDKDLADLNGNTREFRLSESQAFIQGMGQQVASTLFYGNTATNPERFMGLSPRYNTVSTATAASAANVLDAGGTGTDNTSMWLIVWGSNTLHGIFPKGKRTGLAHEDMGIDRVADANGNYYRAYIDHYKWEIGLTVRDWRFAVRIANIDVSDLNTVNAANLINAMVRAMYRVPVMPAAATPIQTSDTPRVAAPMGRAVFYANRTVRAYLDLQAMNKANVLLQLNQMEGKTFTTFRGVPIKTCDALVNNEARVV